MNDIEINKQYIFDSKERKLRKQPFVVKEINTPLVTIAYSNGDEQVYPMIFIKKYARELND